MLSRLGSLERGAFILLVTSGISYGLGLVRDRTLAATYGASDVLDAYQAAFVIPDAIFNLFIAGALTTAFLPVYTDLVTQRRLKEAAQLAGTLLTGGLLVLTVISLIAFLLTPNLASLVAPGFSQQKQNLLVSLTRIMLVSPLIFLASNLLGSMLVSRKRFLWYGLSPILYNLGIIIGIAILSPAFGIFAAAIGTTIGGLLHVAARAIDVGRMRLRVRVVWERTAPINKVVRLMIPRLFGLAATQAQLWIFVAIASTLGEGAVTVYSLARNFQSFPVSLIGIAFATSVFPLLSESASRQKRNQYVHHLMRGVAVTAALATPAAIALYLIRTPLIGLLVGGGQFTTDAVIRTATVLGVYTLSIPTESLVHILARGFYALHNTLVPVTVSIVGVAVSVVSAWLLAPTLGVTSIPTGFAAGTVLQMVLLAVLLQRYTNQAFVTKRA